LAQRPAHLLQLRSTQLLQEFRKGELAAIAQRLLQRSPIASALGDQIELIHQRAQSARGEHL